MGMGKGTGTGREWGPIRLELGEGVCVVGWVRAVRDLERAGVGSTSAALGAGEDKRDGHIGKAAKEEETHEDAELELDRRARQTRSDERAWDRLRLKGWVVDAIQISNVRVYDDEPGVGVPAGRSDGSGQADVFQAGGTDGWGRRKGLERYD